MNNHWCKKKKRKIFNTGLLIHCTDFTAPSWSNIRLRSEKLLFSFARSLIRPSRRNLIAIKLHTANTDVSNWRIGAIFTFKSHRKKRVDRNKLSHGALDSVVEVDTTSVDSTFHSQILIRRFFFLYLSLYLKKKKHPSFISFLGGSVSLWNINILPNKASSCSASLWHGWFC